MPIQTTYNFLHDPLLQGMPATAAASQSATGYADAEVGFGLGLIQDGEVSNGRLKVAVPSSAFTIGEFVGISQYTQKQQSGTASGLDVLANGESAIYAAGDDITYAQKMRIVVYVEEACGPGSPVFLRHTASGGGTAPGQFRTDADTANAVDVSAVAAFRGTTSAAGLVELEINIP